MKQVKHPPFHVLYLFVSVHYCLCQLGAPARCMMDQTMREEISDNMVESLWYPEWLPTIQEK